MKNAPFKHPLIKLGFPTSASFLDFLTAIWQFVWRCFSISHVKIPNWRLQSPFLLVKSRAGLVEPLSFPSFSTHGQSWENHPKLVPDTSVAQLQAHGILGLVHGSPRSWTQLIQRLKNGTVHHEFLHVSTIWRGSNWQVHRSTWHVAAKNGFQPSKIIQIYPKVFLSVKQFKNENPTSSSCFRPRWVPSAPEM